MAEQREWKIKCVGGTIFAYIGKQGNYKATMSEADILTRINAADRLRAGIDELKDASKDDPQEMGGPFVSLSWVERTLEGE